MSTFSPSPVPRRTVRRQTTSHGHSPPIARRTRAGGSKPPSRFATPARHQERLPSVRDDESHTSGMDVDEGFEIHERISKAETIFAKSEESTATFYAQLPVEVKQALRNADFYRDAYTGDVDPLTGFAVVASRETCFVWKYSQALTGTPTCYIFLCPQDVFQDAMVTPFHALVPYGPSREPGLIISSPTGQIRFWDSLGMGLAGGDKFALSSLELDEGENVTTLTRSDPKTYIVSTSKGRLFRLVLTSTGGSYHLVSHVFNRPQSPLSLSRLLPTMWSVPNLQPQAGNISAVALGEQGKDATGKDVWAIIDLRLQRWNMSVEGWEDLILEDDIAGPTRVAIREAFTSASRDDAELDLELLDLKIDSSKNLVMLVSYAGQEDASVMDLSTHPRRIYVVVRLLHTAGDFEVVNVKSVPYQSTSSSGAPMHPRLQLIQGGELIAIQFGDAVTFCAREKEYMDRLELKSATDRTLGVGVIEGQSELLVLTAATMMKAYFDMDQIVKFDPETGRANLIKSTMTQAILYGSYIENPLHFSFPPEIDEEALMAGAEHLSRAILESNPEVVRPHHDLQSQMAGRKERLSFLIKFINDNAALTKMSQRSRQRLATDAEKLYAAYQLWVRHGDFLGASHATSILNEAVYAYMNKVGESHHEDCVRAFFRLRIEDLGNLLPHVLEVVRQCVYENSRTLTNNVVEANRVVLTVLQSATHYREYNLGVYGVELPLMDPWSSQPFVINIVTELFNTTTKLVEMTPTANLNGTQTQEGPRAQLPELASILFACIKERLEWLDSPVATETTSVRERSEFEDRFRQLRPEVLETLRRNGSADDAFKLAEDYRDFRSLAFLCHKDAVYPPQDNPNAARIQSYIEKFKEDFTTELYQWYIEHGELRTMFTQEHDEYMDAFFSKYPNPAISWIHDLGRGRYGLVSESLLSEAENATELVAKHLMLSIGKLSHLAQLHENDVSINQNVLDAFHDGLDFVSVHETLIDDLKSALVSVRARQSLEMQVETIAQSKASNLADRRALQNVFKKLVRQLLQGKALSMEDVADVLSLKDNTDTREDYTTALHLLSRAENIPDTRRLSAFRSVWRRIYIHDDWDMIQQTANVTDAELNERLRGTALYVALQATMTKRHQPEGYVSSPPEALTIPEQPEIALRWPGMSPDEVEAVERDCEKESRHLENLGLGSMYESMRELVAEDEGWTDIA
ncbi:hypothetical protein AcW1_005700 [Taiwanofungus camphoratus]|nr:hypothetical protein AcW1_005700 [Antrodia cinnamomea]